MILCGIDAGRRRRRAELLRGTAATGGAGTAASAKGGATTTAAAAEAAVERMEEVPRKAVAAVDLAASGVEVEEFNEARAFAEELEKAVLIVGRNVGGEVTREGEAAPARAISSVEDGVNIKAVVLDLIPGKNSSWSLFSTLAFQSELQND